MNTYPLDQATALYLSGILSAGHPEVAEEQEAANPWPPLSRAALSGGIPRAPRQHWRDEEEGDVSSDLLDGEEEFQERKSYAPHVLPSMRDRASVRAELRGMGIEW